MEKTLFRSAIKRAYFDLQRDLRWYLRRNNDKFNKEVINRFIEVQTLLLSPFTPHLCEEIWNKIGKKGFISQVNWPNIKKVDYKGNEVLVKTIIDDIKNILKIIEFKPRKVYLYSIPKEKDLLKEAKEFFEKEFGLEFYIFNNNDKEKYDPKNKATKAKLNKPSIYLE